MNTIVCTLCSTQGHSASRCKELIAPLKDGFQAGGGGGHSHDDDEDEKLCKKVVFPVLVRFYK